jgi:hypothetical protein
MVRNRQDALADITERIRAPYGAFLLACIFFIVSCSSNSVDKTAVPVTPAPVITGEAPAAIGAVATALAPVADISPTAVIVAGTKTLELKAEAGDTVVNLTWLPMSDAHGFLVYRDGNPAALNSSPVIGTVYQDSGLTNSRTYSYTIAALDAAGQPEMNSNAVQVTPKSK